MEVRRRSVQYYIQLEPQPCEKASIAWGAVIHKLVDIIDSETESNEISDVLRDEKQVKIYYEPTGSDGDYAEVKIAASLEWIHVSYPAGIQDAFLRARNVAGDIEKAIEVGINQGDLEDKHRLTGVYWLQRDHIRFHRAFPDKTSVAKQFKVLALSALHIARSERGFIRAVDDWAVLVEWQGVLVRLGVSDKYYYIDTDAGSLWVAEEISAIVDRAVKWVLEW